MIQILERRNRSTVRLTDVLALIAVALILSPVLFGAAVKMREAAGKERRALCYANIRAVTVGLSMYNSDWDDRMPIDDISATSGPRWTDKLIPYLGYQYHTFPTCPAAPKSVGNTYGFNYHYLNGKRLGDVLHPADTVAVCEVGWNSPGTPAGDPVYYAQPPAFETTTHREQPAPWHDGGCHVGFVDGHVVWMPIQMPLYPQYPWDGNDVWDSTSPAYKNRLWDLL